MCGDNLDVSWWVTPVRGTVAATDLSGNCWDSPCSAPDPYVVLGGSSTSTAYDTYRPTWSRAFLVSYSDLKAGVLVQLWDEDISSDDLIGKGTLKMTDADLRAGTPVTLSNFLCSITFEFKR